MPGQFIDARGRALSLTTCVVYRWDGRGPNFSWRVPLARKRLRLWLRWRGKRDHATSFKPISCHSLRKAATALAWPIRDICSRTDIAAPGLHTELARLARIPRRRIWHPW
jgi:hypothetical protein